MKPSPGSGSHMSRVSVRQMCYLPTVTPHAQMTVTASPSPRISVSEDYLLPCPTPSTRPEQKLGSLLEPLLAKWTSLFEMRNDL